MAYRKTPILAASMVALTVHGAAFAQQGEAPKSTDGSTQGITEIVVTAQKRSESSQKTAAAVTAVTGAQLVASGISDLREIQVMVPGARFQQEGNSTQVFLRGVGSNADFANIEQGVSTNFNGLYIPREATSVPLYDVAQVEALPGPQGTLYGRSAIGGTVNIAFERPNQTQETKLVLEGGNYSLAHVTAVENLPLSSDLAIRAAVDYTYRNGYMTSGADSKDDFAGRLSALYKPNNDLSIYVWGYTVQKNGSPPNLVNKGLQLANGTYNPATNIYNESAFLSSNPWNDTRTGNLAGLAILGKIVAPNQTYNNSAFGGQIDLKLGSNVTLSEIPGYLFLNMDDRDYWLGALPAEQHAKYHELSNELRLAGISGNLKWLGGIYAYRTINSGGAVFLYGLPQAYFISNVLRNALQGVAVFGQGTYSVSRAFRLTAGGRYGVDSRDGFGITPLDQTSTYTYHKKYTRFDYKAGFEYDVALRAMAYVTIQSAYQPGTYNEFQGTAANPADVKPSTLTAITGGIKTRWLNNTLQINDEAFYYDYRNFQLQAINVNAILNPIFNAAKVTIPGNQLDILYQPDRDNKVSLSVSYVHARNKDFVTPSGSSYDNLSPPYAADWTISGTVSHDLRLNSGFIRASVDARYESKWWADYEHSQGVEQKAHAKVNASLTYFPDDSKKYSIGAWIKNITNIPVIAAAAAAGFPGPGTAYLEEPRTFGVRATASF